MIDLLPSEAQQQIVDAARSLLAGRMPVDRLRGQQQGDAAADAWDELVGFGWFLFGLPEEAGGLGQGIADEMLLFHEAGRSLLPPSVLATTLAAHAASGAGDSALVAELTEGAARAGFALREPVGDSWLLIDAEHAGYVVALSADQASLHSLDDFEGRRPIAAIDEAATLERATLTPGAKPILGGAALAERAVVLLASQLAGAAEASLELAAEYARIREQFGQPIGAFQAVKHRCSDMAVRAESVKAQVGIAALSQAEGLPDAGLQLWAAALTALTAARENGASCIQVHGGMGFTWECHAHRYLKRAQLLGRLLGGPRAVENRLLQQQAAG